MFGVDPRAPSQAAAPSSASSSVKNAKQQRKKSDERAKANVEADVARLGERERRRHDEAAQRGALAHDESARQKVLWFRDDQLVAEQKQNRRLTETRKRESANGTRTRRAALVDGKSRRRCARSVRAAARDAASSASGRGCERAPSMSRRADADGGSAHRRATSTMRARDNATRADAVVSDVICDATSDSNACADRRSKGFKKRRQIQRETNMIVVSERRGAQQ